MDVIGIDGIILLETFKEQNGVAWTGLHSNESVESINAGKLSSS